MSRLSNLNDIIIDSSDISKELSTPIPDAVVGVFKGSDLFTIAENVVGIQIRNSLNTLGSNKTGLITYNKLLINYFGYFTYKCYGYFDNEHINVNDLMNLRKTYKIITDYCGSILRKKHRKLLSTDIMKIIDFVCNDCLIRKVSTTKNIKDAKNIQFDNVKLHYLNILISNLGDDFSIDDIISKIREFDDDFMNFLSLEYSKRYTNGFMLDYHFYSNFKTGNFDEEGFYDSKLIETKPITTDISCLHVFSSANYSFGDLENIVDLIDLKLGNSNVNTENYGEFYYFVIGCTKKHGLIIDDFEKIVDKFIDFFEFIYGVGFKGRLAQISAKVVDEYDLQLIENHIWSQNISIDHGVNLMKMLIGFYMTNGKNSFLYQGFCSKVLRLYNKGSNIEKLCGLISDISQNGGKGLLKSFTELVFNIISYNKLDYISKELDQIGDIKPLHLDLKDDDTKTFIQSYENCGSTGNNRFKKSVDRVLSLGTGFNIVNNKFYSKLVGYLNSVLIDDIVTDFEQDFPEAICLDVKALFKKDVGLFYLYLIYKNRINFQNDQSYLFVHIYDKNIDFDDLKENESRVINYTKNLIKMYLNGDDLHDYILNIEGNKSFIEQYRQLGFFDVENLYVDNELSFNGGELIVYTEHSITKILENNAKINSCYSPKDMNGKVFNNIVYGIDANKFTVYFKNSTGLIVGRFCFFVSGEKLFRSVLYYGGTVKEDLEQFVGDYINYISGVCGIPVAEHEDIEYIKDIEGYGVEQINFLYSELDGPEEIKDY